MPGRTVADLAHDTVLRLSAIGNIAGLKDATGHLGRGALLMRDCDPDFMLLSGDDATCAAFLLQGGHGVISVTANVAPKLMKALCAAAAKGDVPTSLATDRQLSDLHRSLFVDSNPAASKWCLAQMGLCQNSLRLPLLPLNDVHAPLLMAAMHRAGIDL